MRQFGDVTKSSCSVPAHRRRAIAQIQDDRTAWRNGGTTCVTPARSLRRVPGFALLAVTTLAAGITAPRAFSAASTPGYPRRAIPQPQQLVFARSFDTRRGRELSVSFADYADLRERSVSSSPWLHGFHPHTRYRFRDGAERVAGAKVSPNFFSTLSVEPALAEDSRLRGQARPGSVVILSHGCWKTRLNGDPVNRWIEAEPRREPYTIVGVLPERFHLTLAGRANIWTAAGPTGPGVPIPQAGRFLHLIGRMKTGRRRRPSAPGAQQHRKSLAAAYPDSESRRRTFLHFPQRRDRSPHWRTSGPDRLRVTLGLLLMACSNVAICCWCALSRKAASVHQLALGASRGGCVRRRCSKRSPFSSSAAGRGHPRRPVVHGLSHWDDSL